MPDIDDWKGLHRDLARPFSPAAIKFRMQDKVQVVPFIDARSVVARLNYLVPGRWSEEYSKGVAEGWIECQLIIGAQSDFVAHRDMCEINPNGTRVDAAKTGASESLKRAAVKFGIGASLYAVPRMFVPSDKLAEFTRAVGQSSTLVLTEAGVRHFRSVYERWLKSPAGKAWGEPLDHNDDENAAGEVEGPADVTPVAPPPPPRPGSAPVTPIVEPEAPAPEPAAPVKAAPNTTAKSVVTDDKPQPKKGDPCPECKRLEEVHGRALDKPGVLWPDRRDSAFLQCGGQDAEFGNKRGGWMNHRYVSGLAESDDDAAF